MLRQLAAIVRAVSGKPDVGVVSRLEVRLGMNHVQNSLGNHAGNTQLSGDRIPEMVLLVCALDAGCKRRETCRVLDRFLVRTMVVHGSVYADPRP